MHKNLFVPHIEFSQVKLEELALWWPANLALHLFHISAMCTTQIGRYTGAGVRGSYILVVEY